jgi:hypothetical protein
MSLKNPVTPPGIDLRTVRLVAQRLNHYATPGPYYLLHFMDLLQWFESRIRVRRFMNCEHDDTKTSRQTVGTNGTRLFSNTNCHNLRYKQTFADRTKVLYITIGVLTSCIEA